MEYSPTVCSPGKPVRGQLLTLSVLLVFQNVPPDLSICTFVLEQSLSVRALQEMLANIEEKSDGVSVEMGQANALSNGHEQDGRKNILITRREKSKKKQQTNKQVFGET